MPLNNAFLSQRTARRDTSPHRPCASPLHRAWDFVRSIFSSLVR